jgi:inner membrane transporter RhtA
VNRESSRINAVPPWTLALVSMTSVQLGLALSSHLISTIGEAATAWLRLLTGSVMFLLIARPPLKDVRRRDWGPLIALGVITGLQTIAFLDAVHRIPLGTAVGIEFLGPVCVAAVYSHSRRALIWPALALAGVMLLTEPWQGTVNLAGIGYALFAAAGWGTYIVLTQRVGDRFEGIDGLTITIPVAMLTALPFGISGFAAHCTAGTILDGVWLGVLFPLLPYACEMLALKRMNAASFGTLMALEPAIGALFGFLILSQTPSPLQVVGVLLVVLAGAGAARRGERQAVVIME